jgi:hypothetical protein
MAAASVLDQETKHRRELRVGLAVAAVARVTPLA